MVERYCSDKGFCGDIDGTIMGQMINTESAEGILKLKSSIDPSDVAQQRAYHRLIEQKKLMLGNRGHAEWTIPGYLWFMGLTENFGLQDA